MRRVGLTALTVIESLVEGWYLVWFIGEFASLVEHGIWLEEGIALAILPLAALLLGFNLYLLVVTRAFERWSELPRGVRTVASIGWVVPIALFALGFLCILVWLYLWTHL